MPARFRHRTPSLTVPSPSAPETASCRRRLQERAACVLRLQRDVRLLARLFGKLLRYFTIARRFTGMNDVVTVWSKDLEQRRLVIVLGCVDERIRRFFRSRERFPFCGHGRLRGRRPRSKSDQ